MEARMLTDWISPDALKSLNDGFVVAIMLEAKEGEADALAEILRVMTPPTMAEPGVKLFLSYRSPANPLLFFIFELYVNEAAWAAHEATDHFKTAIVQLLPRVTRRERVPFGRRKWLAHRRGLEQPLLRNQLAAPQLPSFASRRPKRAQSRSDALRNPWTISWPDTSRIHTAWSSSLPP